ncbi:MAG TPA: class I fructose-bisphosphate aldolase [Dehalococcoidia bacterium]|nr:class I fructose-bisphosphate aldolase [Dehalococcoidia bacterium]
MGYNAELAETARALVAPAKGILAADESSGTIKRRFDAISVENTEDNRRNYRELLFRTPGANEFVSGIILFDETIRQKAADGTPLVKVLESQGIIPGIKVDAGAKPLAFAEGEVVTEGLDGLRERFAEYRELGARFSKWRAVIPIGAKIPSHYGIEVNAHALARYAALSQEAGIVPIVEPEVLMDDSAGGGIGDHSIERCFEVTRWMLHAVFNQLLQQHIQLSGMLLKPNMVLSGKKASNRAPAEKVAEMTVTCFKDTVPAAVPGIVFLSGGQSDEEATVNLDAINRYAAKVGGVPWELSYSYGRGLQAAPQKAWAGKAENVKAAQAAYYHRAKVTSAARQGRYEASMELAAARA